MPTTRLAQCTVLLDVLEVASPCPVRWSDMSGDERSRRCSHCQLQVYNISDMSRPEAEAFLSERVGRTCVRFYRRADGTILTQDCPRGMALVRRGIAMAVTSLAVVLAFSAGMLWWNQQSSELSADLKNGPLHRFAEWIDPPGKWTLGF